MKIAVFHNLSSGGAKRALYNFVKYLTKATHSVDVFVPDTADEKFLPLTEIANKVTVFPTVKTIKGIIPSLLRYRIPPIGFLERTHEDIAASINKNDYDVVLAEQDRYTMSPFFLKFIKKPTVYFCQQPFRADEAVLQKKSQPLDNWFIRTGKKIPYRLISKIDKQNVSYTNYIVANSYFSRESILRSYGLNAFVCYLGIDNEVFRPLDGLRENYVLSVGACQPSKGFDFIIQAISLINEKIRPPLVIVSNTISPSWRDYIRQLALQKKVGVEIKHLTGEEELVQLYRRAKLFLYAPYLEPFGIAVLEAMACGTPVVAVREGGIRESIVHNETGILTERDELEFAEAITKLISDENRWKYLSRKAMEFIQGFWTLDHAGRRLYGHLERAVNLYQDRITVENKNNLIKMA